MVNDATLHQSRLAERWADHLRTAARGEGLEPAGVWVPAEDRRIDICLVVGVLWAAGAGWSLGVWDADFPVGRGLCFALGLAVTGWALWMKWSGSRVAGPTGCFLDGEFLWIRRSWEIERRSLDDLRRFELVHRDREHRMQLSWSDGTEFSIGRGGLREADELQGWLSIVIRWRKLAAALGGIEKLEPHIRVPGGIAAAARAELRSAAENQRRPVRPFGPPSGESVPSVPLQASPRKSAVVAGAVALLVTSGALAVLGPGLHAKYRHGLAARALREDSGSRSALAYLKAFPQGSCAAEALKLYDERLFDEGLREARDNRNYATLVAYCQDPRVLRRDEAVRQLDDLAYAAIVARDPIDWRIAALKAYLALPVPLTRREAAEKQLAGTFEEMIQRLETRGRVYKDPLLLGLAKLMRATPAEKQPTIRVAVTGRYEVGSKQVTKEPWATQFAKSNQVLDPTPAFAAAPTARREGLIARRLEEALFSILGYRFVQFVRVRESGQADLVVDYAILPTEQSIPYVKTTTTYDQHGAVVSRANRTEAELRVYRIEWNIVLRVPGGADPVRRELRSFPGDHLMLKGGPNDPEWAPYAVLLYSSFDGLHEQILENAGIPKRGRKTELTYDEASGL